LNQREGKIAKSPVPGKAPLMLYVVRDTIGFDDE